MRLAFVLFACAGAAGCSERPAPEAAEQNVVATPASGKTDVQLCVERGIAYFQEIDAFPTLKSAPNKGRLAVDVAAERCQRTTTAF